MFLLILAIIAAVLLLVPDTKWLRRAMGYQTLVDIVMSSYMVSTYAATGAVSGLTIAVLAALGFSLTLRGIRWLIGYEKLAVNGVESARLLASELLTQSAHWVRAFALALFRKGRVEAPAPLNVEWVYHEAPIAGWMRKVVAYATA